MADFTEEAVLEIRKKGFYIAKNVVSHELCDELLKEIKRLEVEKVPPKLKNNFHGFKTQRFCDLLNYGDVWQHVPVHPCLLSVAKGVLGDDVMLNTYQTSIIGPGETRQPIHVDDGILTSSSQGLRNRPHLPEFLGSRESIVMNTLLALNDFTEENGATHLVPGSNLMDYPKEEDSTNWIEKSVRAVMPKGSILFWDGQTYHAGGANQTDQKRYAVLTDYCAAYLRPQENFLISVGAERVGTFPKELQWLMGYRISKQGLGHVYNDYPVGMQGKIRARDAKNLYGETADRTDPSQTKDNPLFPGDKVLEDQKRSQAMQNQPSRL